MLRVAVCILAIFGASALTVQPIFTFKTLSSIFHHNYDDCKICYGHHDCLTMDKARCEYYMEVEDMLPKTYHDEDEVIPELKESVDAMLFDLVEKAGVIKECIPYISEYTDCTKENVCTGCKKCSCSSQGEWNCTIVQKCRADVTLNVDHKVLVSVIERLKNYDLFNRKKRAVIETTQNVKKITNEEIAEWLYDVKPLKYIDNHDIKVNDDTKNKINLTTAKVSEHQEDIDYLAFDEVLNNIAVDLKNYSRRKPPLDAEQNETENMDHMIMENINITTNSFNVSDQFMNMLNEIEGIEAVTEAPTEETTKVFIDFIESNKQYAFNYNETDYTNGDKKLNNELKPFDYTNNFDEFNLVNIIKREISNASHFTENISTEKINNITESAIELKNNVLQPLTDIISEKEKELQELLRVKENLMRFMKSLNSGEIELNFKNNKTDNNSNTYFSIYKIENIPQFDYDLRTKNPQVLEKYLYKLKRDIYEVIKDIVGIKQLSVNGNIPQELKVLIRAMKYYIRNGKKSNTEEYENLKTRRQYYNDMIKTNLQSTKDIVIEIFELLDEDMPEANSFTPISQTAKKILKRIIKNYYVDEYVATGLKVQDKNNNLKDIGNNWQEMTVTVVKSSLHDRLYAMKLLYLKLTVDISKIADALTLKDLAHHNRRTLDPQLAEGILKNIQVGLQNINNKIINITHDQNKSKQIIIDNKKSNSQKMIFKESFFKQIRNLFNSSKNGMKNLLKKKVPKSEIIKTTAKKKLFDLTRRRLSEYEEVMKRWQYNLDLVPKRYKRSPKDRKKRMKNRIKNIIPRYLRGKINPKIVAKDSTKKSKTKKHGKAVSVTTMKNKRKLNKFTNETKVQ